MSTKSKTLTTSKSNDSISYLDSNKNGKPITFIGNESIRKTFDSTCIEQALNTRNAPGVEEVVINPDAHAGYGAPIGCVVKTTDMIYPGPVGFDMKCSMSHLQLDLPEEELKDKRIRRAVINAIEERMPTGVGKGQKNVLKSRRIDKDLGWGKSN